jgi:cytochrome d ubiquinol oxidase subunit I
MNPWALLEYAHNMCASVVTASFVMASVGAFYLLEGRFTDYARIFVKTGVIAGCVSCILMIFPTGDMQGKYIAKTQPASIAAMEGLFHTEKGAGIAIMGQPNEETETIDNPLVVNKVLSFLIYGTTTASVEGLNHFPREDWPEPMPLLYYCYHIMAGLGTYFVALMVVAAFLLWRGKLYATRWILWPLMLSFPLPYVATTAGWVTAEIGRQPWVVYGLMRTSAGSSKYVSAGNALFTLLGFMGLYTLLGILFLLLIYREINRGPHREHLRNTTLLEE